MLQAMDTAQLVALSAALGWASGLRLYAVLALTGLAGWAGWMTLPPGLQLLQHPLVLGASWMMVFVEFFADKIPGLDSLWDMVHTLIRIPAGAALAAAVFGGGDPSFDSAWMLVAALLGGTLAATSHVSKATTRAAVNTSPEPFSNVAVSLLEDGVVPLALWLSVAHPVLFFVALGVTLVLMVVSVWVLARFLRLLWRRVRGEPAGRQAEA